MTVEELIAELKNIDGKKDIYVRKKYGYLGTLGTIRTDSVDDVCLESI